jgi:hypothetical protein
MMMIVEWLQKGVTNCQIESNCRCFGFIFHLKYFFLIDRENWINTTRDLCPLFHSAKEEITNQMATKSFFFFVTCLSDD